MYDWWSYEITIINHSVCFQRTQNELFTPQLVDNKDSEHKFISNEPCKHLKERIIRMKTILTNVYRYHSDSYVQIWAIQLLFELRGLIYTFRVNGLPNRRARFDGKSIRAVYTFSIDIRLFQKYFLCRSHF